MLDVPVAAERIAEWLAVIATPLQDIPYRQPSLYASLRPALERAYRDAGSPLGEEEAAMLRWWQQRAQAERAGWLAHPSRNRAPRPLRAARGRAR